MQGCFFRVSFSSSNPRVVLLRRVCFAGLFFQSCLFLFFPFWFWLNGLFYAELVCACLFVWGCLIGQRVVGTVGLAEFIWMVKFGRDIWQKKDGKNCTIQFYLPRSVWHYPAEPPPPHRKEPANYVCAERIVPSSWHIVLSATTLLARKSLCRKVCAIYSCHLADIKRYEIIPLLRSTLAI